MANNDDFIINLDLISDDEEIDFGQGLIEESFPFDHAKYFFNAWDYIVKKWAIKNNLALTCKMNILNQINSIERSIEYLSKTLEEKLSVTRNQTECSLTLILKFFVLYQFPNF